MDLPKEITKTRTPKTRYPLIRSIGRRFSPRVFTSEQISKEHLDIIFEAARLAPSARNHQPWFYYWMRKGSPAYEKIRSCFPERNLWIFSAPVITSCGLIR